MVGIASTPLLISSVVAICFLKERTLHGTIGFLFAPLAIYGACRIGKPDSPWARRRYGERRPKKQAKAERRFPPDRRTDRFKERFRDIVGGKPSEGVAAVAERGARGDPRSRRRSARRDRTRRPPRRHRQRD